MRLIYNINVVPASLEDLEHNVVYEIVPFYIKGLVDPYTHVVNSKLGPKRYAKFFLRYSELYGYGIQWMFVSRINKVQLIAKTDKTFEYPVQYIAER